VSHSRYRGDYDYSANTGSNTYTRLLEIYKKLRDVVAATSNEATKKELIGDAKTIIREICQDHISAAQDAIQNAELQKEVCESIQDDCQELIDYIIAAKRFNLEVNARSKDRVVGFGEKLSCRFMTAVLKDNVSISRSRRVLPFLLTLFLSTSMLNTSISQTSSTTTALTASVRPFSKTQHPCSGREYTPASIVYPSSQVSSEMCLGV
jgi:aspartokinase